MHALIVETETLIALMIEDVLAENGFDSFAFATTSQEALSEARRRCPDLIVADVDLTDGCAIGAVQSICAGRSIPVIFASNVVRDALVRIPSARAIGKPFLALTLTQAVHRASVQPSH